MSQAPTAGGPRESSMSSSSEPLDARAHEQAGSRARERGDLEADPEDCGLLLEARRAHRELHLSLVAEAAREWEARETRRRGGA